jgi:hypothetical protein
VAEGSRVVSHNSGSPILSPDPKGSGHSDEMMIAINEETDRERQRGGEDCLISQGSVSSPLQEKGHHCILPIGARKVEGSAASGLG